MFWNRSHKRNKEKRWVLSKYDPHFKLWDLIHIFDSQKLAESSVDRLLEEDKQCFYFTWPIEVDK